MKTKNFWSVLVLGTILTSLIACNKEEPIIVDKEIIDSEVLDSGYDTSVKETANGTDGTTLSYESWILVQQKMGEKKSSPTTRAASEDQLKISVTLKNDLSNFSKEIDVKSFLMKNSQVFLEYKQLSERKSVESQYVNIIDSVMVYTVSYDVFSLEFPLPYQVAVYDDGITRQLMPYHKYDENIVDKGYELSDLDELEVDGKTYQRKLYVHRISASFNGKLYELSAYVVLRKEVSGDYLVSSKVIDEGRERLEQDNKVTLRGTSKSWIVVEQNWSESGKKTFTVETILNNKMSGSGDVYSSLIPQKWTDPNPLGIKVENNIKKNAERQEGGVTITEYIHYEKVSVSVGETKAPLFDAYANFFYEVPIYSDDVLVYEMPHFEYDRMGSTVVFNGTNWYQDSGVWYHDILVVTSANFAYENVADHIFWNCKYQTTLMYKP